MLNISIASNPEVGVISMLLKLLILKKRSIRMLSDHD
jgi:hypothetical protein